MNAAHLHLLFNHVPIIAGILGTLILVAGMVLRQPAVKRTALGIFVIAAVAALPAFFSGEGAEEIVEKLPGSGESVIESHEDIGKIFLIAMEVLGVFSLITFVLDRKNARRTMEFYILVLLISLFTGVLGARVGTSGGNIRHPEIQNGASAPANAPGEQEHDDD